MIPPREQDFLRDRFARELTSRVRVDLFVQRPSPIIIPGRQECLYCDLVRETLEQLAALSSRIALSLHDIEAEKALAVELGVDRAPGIVVRGTTNRPIRFFGFPSGTQFPNFVELLLDASRGSVGLRPETVTQLRKLKTDVRLQAIVTTTCPHCPTLARTAARLALGSVRVKLDVIEIAEFPDLGRRLGISAVPTTLIGGDVAIAGVLDEAALTQAILRVAEGKPLGELTPGAFTPIDPAMFAPQPAQTQRPAMTSSGLFLPR